MVESNDLITRRADVVTKNGRAAVFESPPSFQFLDDEKNDWMAVLSSPFMTQFYKQIDGVYKLRGSIRNKRTIKCFNRVKFKTIQKLHKEYTSRDNSKTVVFMTKVA